MRLQTYVLSFHNTYIFSPSFIAFLTKRLSSLCFETMRFCVNWASSTLIRFPCEFVVLHQLNVNVMESLEYSDERIHCIKILFKKETLNSFDKQGEGAKYANNN